MARLHRLGRAHSHEGVTQGYHYHTDPDTDQGKFFSPKKNQINSSIHFICTEITDDSTDFDSVIIMVWQSTNERLWQY